jgi:hypothetical protein
MNTITITKAAFDALPTSAKRKYKDGSFAVKFFAGGIVSWVKVTWTR